MKFYQTLKITTYIYIYIFIYFINKKIYKHHKYNTHFIITVNTTYHIPQLNHPHPTSQKINIYTYT